MSYHGFKSIFFEDQNVFANDLNNIEYSKIKLFRDTLAALIEQPGVSIPDLSYSGLKVIGGVVNPGVAIDRYGRIIYVPQNTSASGSVSTDPYYHPAWPSRVVSGSGNYTNIYYDVQYAISKKDDSGISHYIRMYDSYRIIKENSTPTNISGGICLDYSGSDRRPLLLLRSQLTAVPIVTEAWTKAVQAGTVLNNNVQNISWNDNSGTHKKAEIAYKHFLDSSLMTVQFYVYNASAPGTLQVDILNSLTESVVITNSLNFSAGSGYYNLLIPISTLSTASLYFIRIYTLVGGSTYIYGVIIRIT